MINELVELKKQKEQELVIAFVPKYQMNSTLEEDLKIYLS